MGCVVAPQFCVGIARVPCRTLYLLEVRKASDRKAAKTSGELSRYVNIILCHAEYVDREAVKH